MTAANPLKAVLDVLRKDPGFENEGQRVGQVALLVFLRALDEKESAKEAAEKGYVSPIPKKLRWREWANSQEKFAPIELLAYLRHTVLGQLELLKGEDPLSATVRNVVEASDLRIKNAEVLRRALDILDGAVTSSLADGFEEMVSALPGSAGTGEFYTPRPLVRLMVDMIDPMPGESVFDPACGTGGFLVAAGEHIRQKRTRSKLGRKGASSIHGIESNGSAYAIAVTNLMLRDFSATVEHADALKKGASNKTKAPEVIFCAPPFSRQAMSILGDKHGEIATTDPSVLFLHFIIKALPRGGRAAVVVSNRILFDTADKAALRVKQQLLDDCDLHTIVRLPAGILSPSTIIESNVLLFTKGPKTKEIQYYEAPPPQGQRGYSSSRPVTDEDMLPVLDWWKSRKESNRAWKVSAEEVKSRGYNLDHHAPNPEEDRWPSRALWLRLTSFRGLESLLLELPRSGPAVIIGANGAGKSTVLDALGMLLSLFVTGARSLEELGSLEPETTDIQIGKQECFLRLLVRAGDDEQAWEMNGTRTGAFMMTGPSSVDALLAGLRRDPMRSIPVLCSYPATRGMSDIPQVRSWPFPDRRQEAYAHAFHRGFGPFNDFTRWFRDEEDIENENRLRTNLDYRTHRLTGVRKALERFLSELGDSHFANMRVERLSAKEAEVTGAKPNRLVVDKDSRTFSIEQFSEGERNTILLAADIARRLAIANPELDDPLQGEGIVLIDEIDLHLHPAWQRNIVPALCTTFPNVQFIVSTHSAQVLSRIPRENVFILEDDKLVRTTPHTFGRDSNSILAEVMGVPERPKEIQEKIRRAAALVDEERLEEAKAALEELTALLGEDDTMVVRLRTLASFLTEAD